MPYTVAITPEGYEVRNAVGRTVAGPFASLIVATHAAVKHDRDAQAK